MRQKTTTRNKKQNKKTVYIKANRQNKIKRKIVFDDFRDRYLIFL